MRYELTLTHQLPQVLETVPPLPGEEAIYQLIASVLGRRSVEALVGGVGVGEHLLRLVRGHFPAGQLPPVNGFWSLTLYNEHHFYNVNPLNRYSLGSKTPDLQGNPDCSLTLYAGVASPGADKESNWLPAPEAPFSLYIRGYWPKPELLDRSWTPPAVTKTAR